MSYRDLNLELRNLTGRGDRYGLLLKFILKVLVAGPRGLEPRTTVLETVVLPIETIDPD